MLPKHNKTDLKYTCLRPIHLPFAFIPPFSLSEISSVHLLCLLPPKSSDVALPSVLASAGRIAQVAETAALYEKQLLAAPVQTKPWEVSLEITSLPLQFRFF